MLKFKNRKMRKARSNNFIDKTFTIMADIILRVSSKSTGKAFLLLKWIISSR
jgi:hypothetical protein